MKAFKQIENVRKLRKKLGMNQTDFWGMVGVTQSGGCRYEKERSIPKSVRALVYLVHIKGLDLKTLEFKK